MCGRYYVDDDTAKEIRKLLEHLDARLSRSNGSKPDNVKRMQSQAMERLSFEEESFKVGEIRPTNEVPMLYSNQDAIDVKVSKWGFLNPAGKGVIINARAETAFEKKTFRESLLSRRCIIPARGFYEWDSDKNKIYFTMQENKFMYMAGLYRNYGEEDRFVILTTGANQSVSDIHDRMPLILEQEQIPSWVLDNQVTNDILHQEPPMLNRTAEYMQATFDFLKGTDMNSK
jgi:putative SOS response-associated peptidase YedK